MPDAKFLLRQAFEAIDRAVKASGLDRHLWLETALRLHRAAMRDAKAASRRDGETLTPRATDQQDAGDGGG
jgi:hypothetical protein